MAANALDDDRRRRENLRVTRDAPFEPAKLRWCMALPPHRSHAECPPAETQASRPSRNCHSPLWLCYSATSVDATYKVITGSGLIGGCKSTQSEPV
jgi:hypothetical protein